MGGAFCCTDASVAGPLSAHPWLQVTYQVLVGAQNYARQSWWNLANMELLSQMSVKLCYCQFAVLISIGQLVNSGQPCRITVQCEARRSYVRTACQWDLSLDVQPYLTNLF